MAAALVLMVEEMRAYFHYEPLTGLLLWIKKPCRNIRVGAIAGYLWTEPKSKAVYVRITFKGKGIMAHRVAFVLMTGEQPKGEIDHINGVGTDNRWSNLREATHKENGMNQRLSAANKSGTMGVDFHEASKSWRSRIVVNSKEVHLGTFATQAEAVAARKDAESRFGFHTNHGRPE